MSGGPLERLRIVINSSSGENCLSACRLVAALDWNRGGRVRAAREALHHQLSAGMDRIGSAAGHEPDLAGLDRPAALLIPQREVRGGEREADRAGLAGLQADTPEAAQLHDGARDRSYGIAHVELDHFVARACAG